MSSSIRETGSGGLALCHLLSNAGMGGAENLVVHLANIHARKGNPSHVIIMQGPGVLSSRFDEAVQLHYLNYERASIRNPFRFLFSLVKGYRILAGVLKANDIQVLQTHLPDTNLWGLILQLTRKCQTVITVHSNRFLSGEYGTSFGRWTTFQAYRRMVHSCGAMVTVSKKVKESLVTQLTLSPDESKKVDFIDNGIPMPHPISQMERLKIRAEYGIAKDEIWVVAVGRFAEPKNFTCLVRSAGWLKERGHRVRVLIAGDGPLRGELEELATELDVVSMVAMPGNLDNIIAIMLAADIFAIPSLWEGLPLVLVEAMASGLPVVGSRAKGIVDVVSHGKNGLLSDISDHVGLGESIARLANDKQLRGEMGGVGQQVAQQNYNIESVYENYCKIYDRLK